MNVARLYVKFVGFCLMFHFIPIGFEMWDNPDKYEIKGDFIIER